MKHYKEVIMKTISWLIALAALWVAGAALAQDAARDEAQLQEQVQLHEQAQVEEQVQTRDKAQEKAQEKAQVQPQTSSKVKRRQGADMRHCLDKKDPKAVIRCAEPGRKP